MNIDISEWNFIWFDFNHNIHYKCVKAKSIDDACKLFLRNIKNRIYQIDYEVMNRSKFIDISTNNYLKHYFK